MKLWMSSEQMHECEENIDIQHEIEPRINQLIKNCTLGSYDEWCVITIILNNKGPSYKEIVRRNIKNKVLEFRLKINYQDFINANSAGKKKMIIELLLRSLDLMEKWKDIGFNERERIKVLIQEEYKDILSL